MTLQANTKGALLALAAFGIFAAHDVLVKVLGGTYNAVQIVFFSVLLGFPIATLMLMRDRAGGNLVPVHPVWMALRSAAVVMTATSAFYAFSSLPLTTVYAILFATPLIITVLSIPILGEVVRLRRWLAVLVGLGGVLIVLRPGSSDLTLGHLAALIAAFGGAFASIIVRKIGREERSVVMILYPMVANFVVMGCLLPFVYVPMPIIDLGTLALIAASAFGATLFIIAAYRAGEAVIVAPMQYSQILWATLYGALLFNEWPDGATLIGAGVVIASGIYILTREGRQEVSENRPNLQTRSRPETGTYPRAGVLLERDQSRETQADQSLDKP